MLPPPKGTKRRSVEPKTPFLPQGFLLMLSIIVVLSYCPGPGANSGGAICPLKRCSWERKAMLVALLAYLFVCLTCFENVRPGSAS